MSELPFESVHNKIEAGSRRHPFRGVQLEVGVMNVILKGGKNKCRKCITSNVNVSQLGERSFAILGRHSVSLKSRIVKSFGKQWMLDKSEKLINI